MALLFNEKNKYHYSLDYCANFFDLQSASPALRYCVENDFVSNCTQFLRDKVGISSASSFAIASSLLARMSDDNLHYHTPVHILAMFLFAGDKCISLEPWEQLAIWFHDAIYTPNAVSLMNESQSAAFMRAILPHGHDLTNRLFNDAECGILATAHHDDAEVESKFDVLLDLDLCSFAWTWKSCEIATYCVKKELLPYYELDKYNEGRKKFFEKLLSRGFVYRSDNMRHEYDTLAKDNIAMSLLM